MSHEEKIDMVWAMMSCFEPLEKMVEMSGINAKEIFEIAKENGFDYSYL